MTVSSDRHLLEYARDEGRMCITLDADFHVLIAVSKDVAPSVIRIRREGLRGPELAQLMYRGLKRKFAKVPRLG